jgi:hypothetical protein
MVQFAMLARAKKKVPDTQRQTTASTCQVEAVTCFAPFSNLATFASPSSGDSRGNRQVIERISLSHYSSTAAVPFWLLVLLQDWESLGIWMDRLQLSGSDS